MSTSPQAPVHDPLREPTWQEGVLLAVLSALAYTLTYSANVYVIQAQETFVGVALFFLPAGVKLVAIMVARYWGALGLFCVNFIHTQSFWSGLSWPEMLGVSLVWVGSTLAVVIVLSRSMHLSPDLKGLRFGQFVWLSLTAAVVHGLAFNAYMVFIDVRDSAEFIGSAYAMALGDFLGSGAVMLILLGLFKLIRSRRSK
jgi:hypothetical protein